MFRIFLFSIMVMSTALFADSFDEQFTAAKDAYSSGNYQKAASIIKEFLKKNGRDERTKKMVPLYMETLLRLDNTKYYQKLYRIYLRKFPNSEFLPRLSYLNGIVSAKEKKFYDAVILFSEASKSGISKDLDSLAVKNSEKICSNSEMLTDNELKKLRNENLSDKIKEVVNFNYLKRLKESGRYLEAKVESDKFKEEFSDSKYISDAKKDLRRIKKEANKSASIGLLAPVSGENKELGKLVVNAVRLAVEQYNSHREDKIELVVLDTKGDMVETAVKTNELIYKYGINAIIGPVLSQTATVSAAICMNEKDVVMITPTATDDGIATLGKNIFQLNLTSGTLARKIAEYAVHNLNIRNFAIMSPISKYGDIMTSNFKDEVTKLGATVEDIEMFDIEANDFKPQFESLRSKIFGKVVDQKIMEGDTAFGKSPADIKLIESYMEDSTAEIGGLFVPAGFENATKIAAQTYFFRVRTQLLGSNGWNSPKVILDGKKYVNNAIFSAPVKPESNSAKWVAFSSLYKNKYSTFPDRVAAPLFYDGTNIVLNAISKDASSSEQIVSAISSVKNFEGVSGKITIDPEIGVNIESSIMKISGNKFIRIQ